MHSAHAMPMLRLGNQTMTVIVALASLSLFALTTVADEPPTPKSKTADGTVCILRGYVRDSEEQPIANATVRVAMPTRNMWYSAKDAPAGTINAIKDFLVENRELTTTTNDSGMYMVKIPNISQPIMASMDVAAAGYERLSSSLVKSGDDRTRANHFLNLRRILSSSLGFVAMRLRVGAIAL